MNLELFDADRAAQILGMKRKRVVDLAAKGIIPAVKIGKLWRFRASWLDEWMTEPPPPPPQVRTPRDALIDERVASAATKAGVTSQRLAGGPYGYQFSKRALANWLGVTNRSLHHVRRRCYIREMDRIGDLLLNDHTLELRIACVMRDPYPTHTCTAAERAERERQQDGKCAVCDKKPAAPLVVDHDHKTGATRSLLCERCNHGLGHFKDDIPTLLAAIAYLEKHRG